MKLVRTVLLVLCLVAHMTPSRPQEEEEGDGEEMEEDEWEPLETSPTQDIDDFTPHFIVKLSDGNLLCFAIEGYELFTYNLLTCNYLSVNTFVNVSQYDDGTWGRGHTDIGITVKALDNRVKSGTRVFKATVDGVSKKATMESFGEVDMQKGSILFSVNQGHSNIESQEANYEQFRVVLDRPKVEVWAVMSDGKFFTVYVEDASGLYANVESHGLLGQFLSSKVRIDTAQRQLLRQTGPPVPVKEGQVWDSVKEMDYRDKLCWYPSGEESAIQGFAYEYIVEHLLATRYKFSLFKT